MAFTLRATTPVSALSPLPFTRRNPCPHARRHTHQRRHTHTHTHTHSTTTINTMTHCVVMFAVTKCAAGKKFVPAKSGNAAKCENCVSGTFNANLDASTVCAKHNPCANSTMKSAGTASKDAVCNNPGMFVYNTCTHEMHMHMCLSFRAQ